MAVKYNGRKHALLMTLERVDFLRGLPPRSPFDKIPTLICPNYAMNILLRLPIDLACAIASEWLGLKFLSLLDMAYCNKEQRPNFLELIRCCVVQHLPIVREDSLLIDWVASRETRARELSIFTTSMDSCLVYLMKCGKFISSIKLYEVNMSCQIDRHLSTQICLHCSNLTCVLCGKCEISESVLDILRHCTNLEHLTLVNCTDGFSHIANYEVAPATTHTLLHAIGTHQTALSAIQCISTQFNFQRLYVRSYGNASIQMKSTLRMLEKSGKCIRCLGFSLSICFNDNLLAQAISYCPNVLHLDISLCHFLTDASLESLARHLTHLRTINMSCCNFTDQGLTFLSHHRCDTLQGLFASECPRLTGAGFNAVLRNCHQLHTLGFNLVPQVTNTLDAQLLRNIRSLQTDLKGQHAIAEMLPYFTQLESLYIGNYLDPVLRLPATGAPALCNVILGVANSYSHGNNIVFGYLSSNWSQQQNKAVAALHAQRPNLHIRYEFGNDWPSNFMKLPV